MSRIRWSILFLTLSIGLGWLIFGPVQTGLGIGLHAAFLLCIGAFLWTGVDALLSRAAVDVGRWNEGEAGRSSDVAGPGRSRTHDAAARIEGRPARDVSGKEEAPSRKR